MKKEYKKEVKGLLIGASLMTLVLAAPVKVDIEKSYHGMDITVVSADAFARGSGDGGEPGGDGGVVTPSLPVCLYERREKQCKDSNGTVIADYHCEKEEFNDLIGAVSGNTTRQCNTNCETTGNFQTASLDDPLVFDLDGDGISLVSADDGVLFDMDNDGVKDQTGWVSNTDGLLALDENNNGIIDDQSELFGSSTTGAFKALARYDSNTDGVMNAKDRAWDRLRMWVDGDSDGETDTGELRLLSDFNITEIDLGYNTADEINAGNQVTGRSNFTRIVEGVGKVVSEVIETLFRYFAG